MSEEPLEERLGRFLRALDIGINTIENAKTLISALIGEELTARLLEKLREARKLAKEIYDEYMEKHEVSPDKITALNDKIKEIEKLAPSMLGAVGLAPLFSGFSNTN